MRSGIRWYSDTLTPRGIALAAAIDEACEEIMDRMAHEVEDWARANAPWEDETGEARRGLTAEAVDNGPFNNAIVIYHTVEYGIWLEVTYNGRWGIIVPTVEHFGPEVMGSLESMFALM